LSPPQNSRVSNSAMSPAEAPPGQAFLVAFSGNP
jgi:hypothetical protein